MASKKQYSEADIIKDLEVKLENYTKLSESAEPSDKQAGKLGIMKVKRYISEVKSKANAIRQERQAKRAAKKAAKMKNGGTLPKYFDGGEEEFDPSTFKSSISTTPNITGNYNMPDTDYWKQSFPSQLAAREYLMTQYPDGVIPSDVADAYARAGIEGYEGRQYEIPRAERKPIAPLATNPYSMPTTRSVNNIATPSSTALPDDTIFADEYDEPMIDTYDEFPELRKKAVAGNVGVTDPKPTVSTDNNREKAPDYANIIKGITRGSNLFYDYMQKPESVGEVTNPREKRFQDILDRYRGLISKREPYDDRIGRRQAEKARIRAEKAAAKDPSAQIARQRIEQTEAPYRDAMTQADIAKGQFKRGQDLQEAQMLMHLAQAEYQAGETRRLDKLRSLQEKLGARSKYTDMISGDLSDLVTAADVAAIDANVAAQNAAQADLIKRIYGINV